MAKQRKNKPSKYDKLILEHWAEVCDEYSLPIEKNYCEILLKYLNQGIVGNPYTIDGIQSSISRSLHRLSKDPNPFIVKEGKVFLPIILKERLSIGAKIVDEYFFAHPSILMASENIIVISFTQEVDIKLKQYFKVFCGNACYDVVSINTVVLIFLKDPNCDITSISERMLLKKQLEQLVFDGYYKRHPSLQKPTAKPSLQTQSLPNPSNVSPSTDIFQLPYKPFSK